MLVAYPLLAVLTWHAVQRSVGAQSYCPEPLSFGDVGNLARPRWESFQRVTVKLYPGHFSSEDQAALREVLQEFETAGRTMNCSQVRFVEVKEEAFPIPAPDEGHPGNPTDTDTLYILRRPASEMLTLAAPPAATRRGSGRWIATRAAASGTPLTAPAITREGAATRPARAAPDACRYVRNTLAVCRTFG